MIHRFTALLAVFCLISANISAQTSPIPADTVQYVWPTNASSLLSSTFAETRSAHLHAGIDIRTWGREGYDVYAARDGIVHRIGISPHGYGNVIYLKHDDGSFSLYAHLNRFEENLQAFADSIRFIEYQFELDRIIDDLNMYYKQGDLIGYSGSTGVGPPHLHFELRNRDYKPFNPLLTNLNIRDTLPPVFSALAIEHLHPNSLHYTGHEILLPESTVNGIADFGRFTIKNPAGLAIDVYDRANNTPNVYAVYELIMSAGGDTLFHSKADYFSYENDQMMFLDRSYPILAQTRKGFQRLYNVNGNTLPFYKKLKNRGILNGEPGEYEVVITARDYYGNTSRAKLTLEFEKEPQTDYYKSVPAYPLIEADKKLYLNSGHQKIEPVTLHNSQFNRNNSSDKIHNTELTAVANKLSTTLIPGRRYTLYSTDKNMWLTIPEEALYDTLSIEIEFTSESGFPQITFNPDRIPVHGKLGFGYFVPDSITNKKHIGLYSQDFYRNRLFFLDSEFDGRQIRATVEEIADLRVLHDPNPPYVGRPSIEKNLAGNYIVILPTVDQKSGIDYRNSSIIVNDKPGITEYDPEKDLLNYYNPSFEPERENRVHITVTNGVGNSVSRSYTLQYDREDNY